MKNKEGDKKIFRLVSILNKLNNNSLGVKSSELARDFKVTVRTIQRDLALLNEAGFPLVNTQGRYRFMDGFSLQKLTVTPEEKFLLNLFFKLFSKVGVPFNGVAKDFLNKILLLPEKPEYTSKKEPSPKQKRIIEKEMKTLADSLRAKLEDHTYPPNYIKKIDEFLKEIKRKVALLRKKENVNIKFSRSKEYEQPKPLATISVSKTYFNDPYLHLDFSSHEKNRIFEIIALLPNKFFRTFRIELRLNMHFGFWGTHFKSRHITCFDDFASYLGFDKAEKRLDYECSYGNDKGILITRAILSWEKEIPMPEQDIKPFLKKTGGMYIIADYSKKKRKQKNTS